MRKNILISFILLALFISCNSSKEKESKDKIKIEKEQKLREAKAIRQEKERESAINKLSTKYKLTYNWDTLDFGLSINYLPIIKSQYQLISSCYINDIYQKDSIYYLSISTGEYRTFYFDFVITYEEATKLLDKKHDLILVVNISEIKKIKLNFVSNMEGSAEIINGEIQDNRESHLGLYNSSSFIGKGKIIDLLFVEGEPNFLEE